MTKIGKEVWLFNHNTIPTIENENKYLVVALVEPHHNLPDGSVNNDWDNHLILQKEDGTIFHERDCFCVVCPDDTDLDVTHKISQYLNNNDCSADVFSTDNGIGVAISWGDWKHEHAWCDTLMACLGYNCDDVIVTEDDGSDCYSGEHYYSYVG